MIQIDIADNAGTSISFNTGTADGSGNKWWITQLDGWDLADPRQKFLDKVQDHGQVVGESFAGARALTVSGIVQSPNNTQWWASQYQLKAILTADLTSTVNFGKITVWEDPVTPLGRYALFKIAGRPKFKLFPGNWQFGIPLTCPDPHLYKTDGSDAGVGVL